jgi:hypothetical protein
MTFDAVARVSTINGNFSIRETNFGISDNIVGAIADPNIKFLN